MLAAVLTQEYGVNGMMKAVMLSVVMDINVAIGLVNKLLVLLHHMLTAPQSAMVPMKIMKIVTQDAVTRTSSGLLGLIGHVM